jgi:hypothetical protein
MTRAPKSIFLSVVLLVGACGLAFGGKDVTREALRWTNKLPAGQTLHLRNLNGSVKVVAAKGEAAEVVAVEHKRDGDTRQITMQVQKVKDGYMICALYPGKPGRCDADGMYDAGGDGNGELAAELTVQLPAGALLDATTVNGEVKVQGVTGEVRATTVNGDIGVESTGAPVKANTVNGRVRVRAGAGDVKAKSVNGDVDVTLPAAVDAEVRAETVHGSIDNDFGLVAEGDVVGRQLRGTLGKGTYKIALQTVNGSIKLRKP